MPTIEMMRSITSHDLDRYVEYEEGALRRSFCIWWQYAFI